MNKDYLKKNTLTNKLKPAKEDDTYNYIVKRNSEDWRFVEFHLKSTIPYDAEIKRITTILTPHSKINFDKAAKNKLTTYAWISHSSLSSYNSINKLRTRGKFEIPTGGIDLLYGCLFDDFSFVETESNFVLCKIIIGKSFCKILRDKNELTNFIIDSNTKSLLPEGYESIMFCPNNAFNQSTTILQSSYKSIRYRIYESTSVFPMYSVNFLPQAYHQNIYLSKKICDECNDKEADFFCLNCEFNFCQDCYSQVHHEYSNDKNLKALYSNHEKEYIIKSTTGLCDSCNKDVEYYCKTCNTSICAYCKLLGNHSKGDLANHQLEEIHQYYLKQAPENNDIAKALTDKSKRAQETLGKLKNQIINLKEHIYVEAEKQLENELEKEYTHIQISSSEAVHLNVTKYNLLTLMKDMIQTTKDYFNVRQSMIKSIYVAEFIYTWKSYIRILDHYHNNLNKYISKNKFPDKKETDLVKFNEFKVIPYSFEEGVISKEKVKEETTKINSSMLKQVFDSNQQKANIENTKLLKNMIKNNMNNKNNKNESVNNTLLEQYNNEEY